MSTMKTRIGLIKSSLKNLFKKKMTRLTSGVSGIGAVFAYFWGHKSETSTSIFHFENILPVSFPYHGTEKTQFDKQKELEKGHDQCDNKNDKDDSKYMEFNRPVVHLYLEDLVRKRAKLFYKAQKISFFKSDEPIMKFDWSNVMIDRGGYSYCKLLSLIPGRGKPVSESVKLVFENRSTEDQQHSIEAERKMFTLCEGSLFDGLTINPSTEMAILTTRFGEISIRGNRIVAEKKTPELLKHCIKVPKDTQIKLSMISNKQESLFRFHSILKIYGYVKVSFYNKKEEIIATYTSPVHGIIFEELPRHMTDMSFTHVNVKITGWFKLTRYDEKIVTKSFPLAY